MENITQRSIGRILNLDEIEISRHSRAGENDGNRDVPPSNTSKLGQYEEQLILDAKGEWIKYLSLTEEQRSLLDQKAMQIKNQLKSDIANESSNLSDSQRKELDLLDQQLGLGSSTYKHLQDDYLNSQDELQKIEQQLNRPLDINNREFYLPLMIVLAIAEVPVNRLAFELFFESMPLVSLLISAAVGGLFIYFAHIIGMLIKRLSCEEIKIDKNKIYLGITLICLVSIGLVYFLGIMREQLIAVQNAGSLDLESLLSNSSSGSDSSSYYIGSKGLTLILLNTAIFATGIVASFFRHDPHPDYEKISTNTKKIEKNFLKYKTKFENEQLQVLREFNRRIESNRSQQQSFEKELNAISEHRLMLDSIVKSDKQSLILALTRKVMAYQNGNRKTRKTPPPEYFSSDLAKSIEQML